MVSTFDEKNGKTLSYTLKVPQLVPDAIPCLFPNCPTYLSTPTTSSRCSREEKNKLREQNELAAATAQSIKDYNDMLKKDSFDSLSQLKSKILPSSKWHVISEEDFLTLFFIKYEKDIAPVMDVSVVVDKELFLNVYIKSVKLTKVGEHVLPVTVSSLRTIDSILDAVQQIYLQVKPNSAVNGKFQAVLKLIISLLEPFKNEVENYCNTISFICEQLALIINKQAFYSPQFAIFAGLPFHVYFQDLCLFL